MKKHNATPLNKAIQPDVAQRILENDLPELVEKLRGATVEENAVAAAR